MPVATRRNISQKQQLAYLRRRKQPSVAFLAAKGNNAAFDEAIRRHVELIKMGVNKFGSRSATYNENLHHARLALWRTLLWQSTQDRVTHSKFLGKFQREMKEAVGNDSIGIVQNVKVRLDNPHRNWHERIPDRRRSFNLHLMETPFGLRDHFKSDLRRQLALRERRKRARHKRKEKAKLKEIVLIKRQSEVIKRYEIRKNFWVKLIGKIHVSSVRKPFLFRPKAVVKVLSLCEPMYGALKGNSGLKMMLSKNVGFADRKKIRSLMAIASPADKKQLSEFQLKGLSKNELEVFLGSVNEIYGSYHVQQIWVRDYFSALKREVAKRKMVPKVFLDDLEKIYLERKPSMQSEEVDEFYDEVY